MQLAFFPQKTGVKKFPRRAGDLICSKSSLGAFFIQTISLFFGSSRLIFFKLFSLAPFIIILSIEITPSPNYFNTKIVF